jgi:hypothetical protein
MPVPLKIKVTKEILRLSKACGTRNDIETIGTNCAIAVVLNDIFPNVFVTADAIYPGGFHQSSNPNELKIALPKVAQDFIKVFDSLCAIPNVRLRLPEFDFEIMIPDEIISEINIDEVKKIACLVETY